MAGGSSDGADMLATAALYNPMLDTWSQAPVLHAARRNATATLLAGDEPLWIGAVRLTGPDAHDFAVVADRCSGAPTPPRGSCEVQLRFAPAAAGPKFAVLSFAANTGAGTQTIALASMAVEPPPAAPACPAAPPAAEARRCGEAHQRAGQRRRGNVSAWKGVRR